jgi:hypothetical protein
MNREQSLLTLRLAPLAAFAVILCAIGQLAAAEVTLAWDPNSEPDLAGYQLYYAVNGDVSAEILDVGNVTTVTVTGLLEGVAYWFVATAYNTSGLESDPSNEISTLCPACHPMPPPQSARWPTSRSRKIR